MDRVIINVVAKKAAGTDLCLIDIKKGGTSSLSGTEYNDVYCRMWNAYPYKLVQKCADYERIEYIDSKSLTSKGYASTISELNNMNTESCIVDLSELSKGFYAELQQRLTDYVIPAYKAECLPFPTPTSEENIKLASANVIYQVEVELDLGYYENCNINQYEL